MQMLAEHPWGDECDAAWRTVKAPGVLLGVFAYYQARRDEGAFAHYRLAQAHPFPHAHVGQDYRILHQSGAVIHAHVGKQQGAAHRRAANDAAARDGAVEGDAAAAVVVKDKLGRRELLLKGPDGSATIVEVEVWRHLDQVDVGLPVGVHRAHITPVTKVSLRSVHATIAKAVRHDAVVRHHVGDDILAEVVAGIVAVGIADELRAEEFGIEDIDAHTGQGAPGVARAGGGVFRKGRHSIFVVDGHDVKSLGLFEGYIHARHSHIGLILHVFSQHLAVVHLVDMVAGEDQHIARSVGVEDVNILEYGIGGTLIPTGIHALLCREEFDKFAEFAAQKSPTELDVTDEAVGLVLGEDADAANPGIETVGQAKINDAELAAKGYGRFGPPVGERPQAAAPLSSQYQCQSIFGEIADEAG